MRWLTKLHGRKTPPGLEVQILKRLPLITAVFTVAIGCVVVHIMKGPAYVADSLPVSHADAPQKDAPRRDE